MSEDYWFDAHFQTEGTVPDPDRCGTVCGCTYCRACRDIRTLRGQVTALTEDRDGKLKWAHMLKADLTAALDQRDRAQDTLEELKRIMGCEEFQLPYRVGQLKQWLDGYDDELAKADRKGHEEWERAEAFRRALEEAVEVIGRFVPEHVELDCVHHVPDYVCLRCWVFNRLEQPVLKTFLTRAGLVPKE